MLYEVITVINTVVVIVYISHRNPGTTRELSESHFTDSSQINRRPESRITSYNVCYTKLLRFVSNEHVLELRIDPGHLIVDGDDGTTRVTEHDFDALGFQRPNEDLGSRNRRWCRTSLARGAISAVACVQRFRNNFV